MRWATTLIVMALACMLVPSASRADELDDLQAQVVETGTDYEAAAAEVAEIQAEISELEEEINALRDERTSIQSQISSYTRALYKLGQGPGLIGILLESESLSEFVSTVQYLNELTEDREQALNDVDALTAELEGLQATLEAELEVAEAAMEEAAAEMDAAVAAREELYATLLAQEEEELLQLALEAAQESLASDVASEIDEADEAVEEAEEEAAAGSASGTVSTTTASGLSAIDWSVTKEEFVSTWGARIDAYLSGSPLAGYGTTFAEAAWAYGVDPRLSPAISCVESTKGTYCFRSYNAWGWGSVSWSSWTEAIWAHVAGLASGYGGTLTYAGAAKYCPSNVDHWYYTVLAQMQSI